MSKKEKKSLRKNKQLNGFEMKDQKMQIENINELKKNIVKVFSDKKLSAREAEIMGKTNYQEIIECLDDGTLDNDTNRDEELEKKKGYTSKINHSIRFVSGMSSKGSLLISVLRDSADCVGLIRDMGTTIGLYDANKFLRAKNITAKQWLAEIQKIKDEYSPIDKDKKFINLLEEFFNNMTPQQKSLKYSVEDVYFKSNDEIKQMVISKQINYEINLFTEKLHDKDMTNANLPENPWIAYNYYMTSHKRTKAYREKFLGGDLIKYFKDKEGADEFKPNKMMSTYASQSDKKMVNRVIPIFVSYCISRFVDIADLDDAAIKISRFNDYSNDNVMKYFKELFGLMVQKTTYQEIIDFYEDEYLKVFQNDSWDLVTKNIKELNLRINQSKEYGVAVDALRLQKWDTGLYFISMILCIKHNKDDEIGMDKLVDKTVNHYNKALQGKIDWTDEFNQVHQLDVMEFFNGAKKYKANSINSRVKKLFTNVRAGVLDDIKGKRQDRTIQDKLRDQSLTLHQSAILSNGINSPSYFLFPLSNDDVESQLSNVNFNTGKGLDWTHPNDEENKAVDGFLGMFDDNHEPGWKELNWIEFGVKSQKDYYVKLLEHNINMKNKCTNDIIKLNSLGEATNFLTTILSTDLEVANE